MNLHVFNSNEEQHEESLWTPNQRKHYIPHYLTLDLMTCTMIFTLDLKIQAYTSSLYLDFYVDLMCHHPHKTIHYVGPICVGDATIYKIYKTYFLNNFVFKNKVH